MMYLRKLLKQIEKSPKSLLLLGPRQTGKSTLLNKLTPDMVIDLSDESEFLRFASQAELLQRIIDAEKPKRVLIDEVQRIPSLLNTIQHILDRGRIKPQFLLSGSSARKLRRGQANLLPGRILTYQMSPLTLEEINYDFDLETVLATGFLPGVFTESSPQLRKKILRSYASIYLKEEIQAEALTKNIEGFSRFLMIAAAKSGEFLDFAKLGSQANITQKTATRFFEILEDTLIVFRVEAFAHSEINRLIRKPKYYFFDPGVLNGLLGNFTISGDRRGSIFESFFISQVVNLIHSHDASVRLSSYRTESGSEVDLILELENQVMAIELKASTNVGKSDLRGLKGFSQNYKKKHECIVVYLGGRKQVIDGITILPLIEAYKKIALAIKKGW